MIRVAFLAMVFATFTLSACGSSPKVRADDEQSDDDTSDDDSVGEPDDSPGDDDPGDGGQTDEGEFFTDDPQGCEPDTCDDLGLDCGPVSDGCGDIIDCGQCEDGQLCGIVQHNVCTTLSDICTPIEPDDACDGKECGQVGDGCGGVIRCGECGDGEACGIEESYLCSDAPRNDEEDCEGLIGSCEEADAECGQVGNGCGGTLDCGDCPAGEYCGIDEPNRCSPPPACEPLAPEVACDGTCGLVSNGCGADVGDGLIDCSAYEEFRCPDGEACGGGGVANQCGSGESTCTPAERADACEGLACGTVSDGCSSSYTCGTCSAGTQCVGGACVEICMPVDAATACEGKQCGIAYDGCSTDVASTFDCAALSGGCGTGEYCGLAEPFQCDAPVVEDCTAAASCAELGWECGMAIDDCGNVFDCADEGRTCDTAVETCIGGIDGPARCSSGLEGGPGSDCDVCDAIPTCTGDPPTRLLGRVVTPGRNDPNTANQVGVPNAFVYILRNNDETELPAIGAGIPLGGTSCDRCADQDFGPVLVGSVTDAEGYFVLEGNVPVDREFVLVVKVGRFRRAQKLTLPVSAACDDTTLPEVLPNNPTRLPRTMTDGLAVNIPRFAISTGQLDAIECVLEKMGLATSEFGNPGSTARLHLFRGGVSTNPAGARISDATPYDSALYGDATVLDDYDIVVADCEGPSWDGAGTDGGSFTQRAASGANVRNYVNRGGRMFASHLSFSWLYDNGTLAYDAGTASDTGLGPAATWSTSINTDNTGTGVVSIVGGRPLASPRIESFADWLVNEGVTTAPGYTFTISEPRSQVTGLGASSEEFVYRSGGNQRVQQFSFDTPYGAPEDNVCGRVVYSGFHVVAGSTPNTAIFPEHCTGNLTDQEKVLLYMLFDVGACVGDVPEAPECEPIDCGDRCGTVSNGCGGALSCSCPAGEVCSGGTCGPPGCTPSTCSAQGATCGLRSDGCGGVLDCGPCECSPLGECPIAIECGVIDDGCGGPLECGQCPRPASCVAGQCEVPQCPALECEDVGAECGWIGDGCGSSVNCGPCPSGQFCQSNQCHGCQPRDCADVAAECGAIGDGCGAIVDCGECPNGQVCGAAGPNQCGPPGMCTPQDCADVGAECGLVGDGCGEVVDCGECPPGEVCGLEEPFKCDAPPPCDPLTCEEREMECGEIGDGCGNLVDCGDCPPGFFCLDGSCRQQPRTR